MVIRRFRDLIRLLEEHTEWRAELRRLLLSEELLRLPELVARLAGQREARLASITAHIQALAKVQPRTAEGLSTLTLGVDSLTQRMDSLVQPMEFLSGWTR